MNIFHKKTIEYLLFRRSSLNKNATLYKKRPWHMCFPMNFVKFLRAPFFLEHLWWLLLIIGNCSGIVPSHAMPSKLLGTPTILHQMKFV